MKIEVSREVNKLVYFVLAVVVLSIALLFYFKKPFEPTTNDNRVKSDSTPVVNGSREFKPYFNYDNEKRLLTKNLLNKTTNKKYYYEVQTPSSWKLKSIDPVTTTLENGLYIFKIEEEYEGINCEFDKAKYNETSYNVFLNLYKTLDTDWANFRVGFQQTDTNDIKRTQFIFCQKYVYPNETVEKWQGGSTIGLITIIGPLKYDQTIIDSAMNIISDIKLKELSN